MFLAAGDKLGPYEIVARIGQGGMGAVYRARDPRLHRDVAIKVSSEEFNQRFEREARTIAALNHPNICTLYDVGPDYLVMEYVEGHPPRGPMPEKDALRVARQIADALEAAHEKGIVHRDLKPGNIMVRADGTVKVLDFGLAKYSHGSKDEETLSLSLTETGTIVGTPAYMSPEQVQGGQVDKRADIWALGVLLYEMLAGRRPFAGASTQETLAAVLTVEPDWERVPAKLRRLLRSCLEKDPRKRLRDAGDAWRLVEEHEAPPAEPQAKARATAWLAAAVAFLAIVVAGFWWSASRAPQPGVWSGEWLGGSSIAHDPKISPDGQTLAFLAMVDRLTQVAVMKPESGNWQILTTDRSRGMATHIAWSPDGTRLYFARIQEVPRGIYSIPVLGGEERLVLEDAGTPHVLPDGSFLVVRLNQERRKQLYRFWPETGRVEPLKGLIGGSVDTSPVRVTADGARVVFYGTPLDQPDAQNRLYAMELASEAIIPLAPSVSTATTYNNLAIDADGASIVLTVAAGDANRIVSAPIDGSPELRTLLTLTTAPRGMDVARDGTLYTAQTDRTGEVLRLSRTGGLRAHIAPHPSGVAPLALPLPDGRFAFSSRRSNRTRLMVAAPGEEPAPFVETQDQTAAPAAMISQTRAAFIIGEGGNRTIGLVSVADGRLVGRLNGPMGAEITSLVASPDGSKIYYAASGSIWAIPVNDGTPQRIRAGESVTVDRYRNDLIVQVSEPDGVRLVRVPLAGGPERPIPLEPGIRLTAVDALHPNAVGKDGTILVRVAESWFWPAALLDPRTGRVEILKIGYDTDMMSSGWTEDGEIALVALPFRSNLWRFRREAE